MQKNRDSGLDVVRCFAIVSLPILHSFMYAGFYSINGKENSAILYVLLFALRWVVYCVVPLFMMLTGYLNGSTEMSLSYLKKIVPILFSYSIISIFTVIYMNLVNNKGMGVVDTVVSLFNYTADPYSWYLEMYIGLFLLAPFLNVLWEHLEKNQRKYLVIVLVTVSFAVQINSLFSYKESYVKIVPAWWSGVYPLCYFFIGKWIREYRPKLRKARIVIGVLLLAISEGVITWLFSTENGYYGGFLDSYCSVTCALMTTLLFILLYDIKVKGIRQKVITNISKKSFEIYLLTYITDNFIWTKFYGNIYSARGGQM